MENLFDLFTWGLGNSILPAWINKIFFYVIAWSLFWSLIHLFLVGVFFIIDSIKNPYIIITLGQGLAKAWRIFQGGDSLFYIFGLILFFCYPLLAYSLVIFFLTFPLLDYDPQMGYSLGL